MSPVRIRSPAFYFTALMHEGLRFLVSHRRKDGASIALLPDVSEPLGVKRTRFPAAVHFYTSVLSRVPVLAHIRVPLIGGQAACALFYPFRN